MTPLQTMFKNITLPFNHNSSDTIKPIHVTKRLFLSRFPYQEGITELDVRMTNISRYSMTLPRVAEQVAEVIVACLGGKQDAVVTDAFAHVGGTAIAFARRFTKVIACELHPLHCDFLLTNIKTYGLLDRVEIQQGDFLELLTTPAFQSQEAVFLDPPWGGPSYKYKQDFQYPLLTGGTHIGQVVDKVFSQPSVKCVVLLAPANLDLVDLSVHTVNEFKIVALATTDNFLVVFGSKI